MNEQKKELMLKAAVQFKGVWPEFASIAECASYLFQRFRFTRTPVEGHLFTRTEYEAFIDSLFEGAPDDTTHIGLANSSELSWLKSDGYTWKWMSIGGWRVCGEGYSNGQYDVIPRPRKQEAEPEPIDAEFVEWSGAGLPPVGVECEFSCTARGKECTDVGVVRYMSKYTCVMCFGNYEFVAHPDTMTFRPIKTEAEKEREAGIKALTEILSKGVGDCEPDEYLAKQVWDAGWRPSKD